MKSMGVRLPANNVLMAILLDFVVHSSYQDPALLFYVHHIWYSTIC